MIMLSIYMLGFAAVRRESAPWGVAMMRGGFVEGEMASLREWLRIQA